MFSLLFCPFVNLFAADAKPSGASIHEPRFSPFFSKFLVLKSLYLERSFTKNSDFHFELELLSFSVYFILALEVAQQCFEKLALIAGALSQERHFI